MLKKRIIVTMMISVMLVLSLGITAIASGSGLQIQTSGSAAMENIVQPNTTVSGDEVGGGTWSYGTNIVNNEKYVWSNYYHKTYRHGSTALTYHTTILGSMIIDEKSSAEADAGSWSYAHVYDTDTSHRGQAYWKIIK
ncbi:lactococcin 972 family bacteriocin [Thermoanaerobacterium thermosaccharolyticum]|jgi:hypothetical protein|uniref:lactococcin 972 family bacteriocin n=1 Tax=Thermoanaerobacterium thermosaccharolyticum TaxID=1517 RepID=UPI003DA95ADE